MQKIGLGGFDEPLVSLIRRGPLGASAAHFGCGRAAQGTRIPVIGFRRRNAEDLVLILSGSASVRGEGQRLELGRGDAVYSSPLEPVAFEFPADCEFVWLFIGEDVDFDGIPGLLLEGDENERALGAPANRPEGRDP
jgi:hypothetical protein